MTAEKQAVRARMERTGNHDRNWREHGTRADDWDQRYLDAVFEAILHGDQVLNRPSRTRRAGEPFPIS